MSASLSELEAALHAAEAAGDEAATLVATLALDLEALRPAVEAGSRDSLLKALELVSHPGMVMPAWLGDRLGAALHAYLHHAARTLDEAFGVRRPKGYHVRANRERWSKAPLIVHDALKLQARGVALGEQMFDALGALHGTGKTRAAEYFYHHKNGGTVTYWVADRNQGGVMRPELAALAAELLANA